ncbi:MAG TPA: SDR family oxidoreductase [Solirubrobacteraceae bacterium]|jgi:citronellol/citronellal dehydrogenase
MPSADRSRLLREDLLAGVAVLVAHCGPGSAPAGAHAAAVEELCGELGASVASCAADAAGGGEEEEAALERTLEAARRELGEIDMLVIDAAALFAAIAAEPAADAGERATLIGCLQASWNITRILVNSAFLARSAGERGGRIVYIAPAPGAGAHAEAARAALENLARTLSIEWARYAITPVTIAPGTATPAGEVAALTAYLASPAGAYFSGCLLDLRGPGGR